MYLSCDALNLFTCSSSNSPSLPPKACHHCISTFAWAAVPANIAKSANEAIIAFILELSIGNDSNKFKNIDEFQDYIQTSDEYNMTDNLSESHGKGSYIYTNGDKYVGEWKKGLRHGKGIFTHSDGKVEKGIWKKDKLIQLN